MRNLFGFKWVSASSVWIRGLTGSLVIILVLVFGAGSAKADTPEPDSLEAGLADDVFIAPPPAEGLSVSNSSVPGYSQTSEFFIGHVTVGIVLPESNSGIDPSTEDWTEEERALVKSKVAAAFDWWAARSPQAHLSFSYEDGTASPAATGYEPINHPQNEQGLWIADVMESMGYSSDGTYFDQVRQYNNDIRRRHGSDWAVTIFVVDSSNDADGRFAGGTYFAYAYLNGPFAVITYNNGAYRPENMDAVLAHEVGHLFGAMDQYSSAGITCSVQGGYLGVITGNSQYGDCPSDVTSIMRGGLTPYRSGALDPYAAGQLGWNDSDADGLFDPLDTPLQLEKIDGAQTSQAGTAFHYEGFISQTAFPSSSRQDVLINPLQQVEYRVDGGSWQTAVPTDGAFDSLEEGFNFSTAPLESDDATVWVRVIDDMGNVLLQVPVLGSGTFHISLPVVIG